MHPLLRRKIFFVVSFLLLLLHHRMADLETRLKRQALQLTIVQSSAPTLADILQRGQSTIPSKKLSPIDRLKRILNFSDKKREDTRPKSTKTGNKKQAKVAKPIKWQDDEKIVRDGMRSFHVKYLGSIEVQESRGIHVCEQAIQALLNDCSKHVKAILYISGDALRVVDETNKGIIVDQTIEKVSFCAPDRHHVKGFGYICRDGTTRRWICHGFLTIKETGERLSHNVGYAFQMCLEKKQKRDRACNVSIEYTPNDTSYTRLGSFRPSSILERMIDPQSALIAEPVPSTPPNHKSKMIERPRPKGNNQDAFNRSVSMRSGDCNQPKINAFKRQTSLAPSDLPSIQQTKYHDLFITTIAEEVDVASTTNGVSKLSLFDSTNTIDQQHFAFPPTKSSVIPFISSNDNENLSFDFLFTNSQSTINEVFDSNLSALAQSHHPTNPFSPYGCSMAAYVQSPNANSRQSSIFTPKRGNNPFDDDLVRR